MAADNRTKGVRNRALRFLVFIRDGLFTETGLKCTYCQEPLTPTTATIDHIISWSLGGDRDNPINLTTACHRCNCCEKRDLPLEIFPEDVVRRVLHHASLPVDWERAEYLAAAEKTAKRMLKALA